MQFIQFTYTKNAKKISSIMLLKYETYISSWLDIVFIESAVLNITYCHSLLAMYTDDHMKKKEQNFWIISIGIFFPPVGEVKKVIILTNNLFGKIIMHILYSVQHTIILMPRPSHIFWVPCFFFFLFI